MNHLLPVAGAALSLAFSASYLTAQSASDVDPRIDLKYANFDPMVSTPEVTATLRGGADTSLWIVQFNSVPTDESRAAVLATGAEIHSYLPHQAYVVRMKQGAGAAVQALPDVRWVGYYHPAYRLEDFVRAELASGATLPERRYNIVVVDKHTDKPALAQRISAIGGKIDNEQPGSLLFEATLNHQQLLQAVRFDEVLWIDRWGAPEDDMNNARIQGGANYIESQGGYTGLGITGHQMEGLNPSNSDWSRAPIAHPAGCNSVSSHGHSTAGIVYGNGSSSANARGMAPDAQCIYTSCRTSRYANLSSIISTHQIMFTTASWGSPRTRSYTSVSAEADDICFDLDLVWSNSQSNAGNQDSRAEAWGKNVMACGGINHANNSNPTDDSWQNGSASIGPAADGRTKPDLCAYYDSIITSSSSGGTTSFGGTSGATPIVAGHNALAIQMYTDGVFGNTLRNPGGSRFSNKPKFPTLKALQIVAADQYQFTGSSSDNRREHQGYGFPSLRNMWDDRNEMFIVDEEDIITQGNTNRYVITVPSGRQSLKICMSFADPAGNPSASQARINDLSLRVTAPDGTVYWGNNGLYNGRFNASGGSANTIDTAECVFVSNPAAGNWDVDVIATQINQDGHVETPQVDADYGLVVRGGTLGGSGTPGSFQSFGTSCGGSTTTAPAVCESINSAASGAVTMRDSVGYAFEFTAASDMTVVGYEIVANTNSGGNETLQAGIYWPDAGGAPSTQVASGQINLTTTGSTQRASLTPFPVTAGQTFFIFFQNNATGTSVWQDTGGTDVAYYRLTSGAWGPRVTGRFNWTVRIVCNQSVTAAPVLTPAGLPETGSTYTMNLSSAAPGASAGVIIGFSNTQLPSGAALPIPLDVLGGTGCNLYVSTESSSGFTTSPTGTGSFSLGLPNDPNIVGFNIYHQGYVFDANANVLGLALTNGICVMIGD